MTMAKANLFLLCDLTLAVYWAGIADTPVVNGWSRIKTAREQYALYVNGRQIGALDKATSIYCAREVNGQWIKQRGPPLPLGCKPLALLQSAFPHWTDKPIAQEEAKRIQEAYGVKLNAVPLSSI